MNIVHFAPFAPNRAGIYEAARDMVRADTEAGNDVHFVDVGVQAGDKREEPRIGAVDERGGFRLVTADRDCIASADVLVMHSGIPDAWIVGTQAPIVSVLHGRPLAAYRLESIRGIHSYSLYANIAKWPRVKSLVYFWPEFTDFWAAIADRDKLVPFEFPPIDAQRFSSVGKPCDIPAKHRGRFNGLICDSWREDVDLFELLNGAIEAAKQIPGLTWHIYAAEQSTAIEPLYGALRSLGALGVVSPRVADMDQIYRGHDFVLTPHKIATRIIGEAVCCGTPVVAARGCRLSQHTASIDSPRSVADAVQSLLDRIESDHAGVRDDTLEMSRSLSLGDYANAMSDVYRRACEPIHDLIEA